MLNDGSFVQTDLCYSVVISFNFRSFPFVPIDLSSDGLR